MKRVEKKMEIKCDMKLKQEKIKKMETKYIRKAKRRRKRRERNTI